MKQILLKIKVLVLSIVLLMASNTYSITSHFCGSTLVSVSYLGDTDGCAMEPTTKDDCGSETKLEKKCCSKTTQLLESEIQNVTYSYYQNAVNSVFLFSFVTSYLALYSDLQKEYNFPNKISPPYFEHNYQVLFQTFLI